MIVQLNFCHSIHKFKWMINHGKIHVETSCRIKKFIQDNCSFQSGTKDILSRINALKLAVSQDDINQIQLTTKTVLPFNIGNLDQVTTTRETTNLPKMRIEKYVPIDAPEFQIILQRLFGPDNRPIHMVMVQCSKEDASTLLKLLMRKSNKEHFEFCPRYVSDKLHPSKKQYIINEQRQWNMTFKSIVVKGFKDNGDNVSMGNNTINTTEMNTGNGTSYMTVSEYLRQIKHPTTGELLFDYVHASIDGQREFIVTQMQSGDAEDYLLVVCSKIARNMNPLHHELEFTNTQDVLNNLDETEWQP
jgi:hypothetical protein